MLTPKCPSGDFRAGGGPQFPQKRLCRFSDAVRDDKCAGNRPKKEGFVKHVFSFYNNELAWLTANCYSPYGLEEASKIFS